MVSLVLLLVSYLLLHSFDAQAQPWGQDGPAQSPPEAEVQALKDLFQQCHGEAWGPVRAAGWMFPSGVCHRWYGVKCKPISTDGARMHVTSLDLRGVPLQCTLPVSLAALYYLEVFDASDSLLIGEFPTVVRGWRFLQTLNLRGTSLTGTLPDWLSFAGGFTRLSEISVSGLNGAIPDTMQTLPLATLNLNGNRFSGRLPEWFQRVGFWIAEGSSFTGPCPVPAWTLGHGAVIVCPATDGPPMVTVSPFLPLAPSLAPSDTSRVPAEVSTGDGPHWMLILMGAGLLVAAAKWVRIRRDSHSEVGRGAAPFEMFRV